MRITYGIDTISCGVLYFPALRFFHLFFFCTLMCEREIHYEFSCRIEGHSESSIECFFYSNFLIVHFDVYIMHDKYPSVINLIKKSTCRLCMGKKASTTIHVYILTIFRQPCTLFMRYNNNNMMRISAHKSVWRRRVFWRMCRAHPVVWVLKFISSDANCLCQHPLKPPPLTNTPVLYEPTPARCGPLLGSPILLLRCRFRSRGISVVLGHKTSWIRCRVFFKRSK